MSATTVGRPSVTERPATVTSESDFMTADYVAERRTCEERRRQVVTQQLGQFPRELARCTCGTPSFDRGDHANTCPLGPTPPLSSNPTRPAIRRPPEETF